MNTPAFYYPYEETCFKIKDLSQGRFSVETPWLKSHFEVEVGSENHQNLQEYIECSLSGETDQSFYQSLIKTNAVFKNLDHLPIFYRFPRIQKNFGSDHINPPHSIAHLESPRQLAQVLGIPFFEIYPDAWSWNFDALLTFAKCSPASEEERYDPLAILTCLRRFHYLESGENKIQEVYDRIAEVKNPLTQKKLQALVLRQNHYVTEKCNESLVPALENAQSARGKLEEFIRAELGHDLLLSKGIIALGFTPESIPLTAAVQSLMALLKSAAKTNFLAFTAAIDFFESPQFGDTDHLAEMILKSGESLEQNDAARVLQIHKNINDQGSHDAFSIELASFLKPVEKNTVLESACMAELVSYTIAQVPYDLERFLENETL